MGRHVAFATALLVTVGVFTWLAGPLLETQFGTEALIVTYGALAVVAGSLTYVFLRAREGNSSNGVSVGEDGTVQATIELEEADIDEEMKQLKGE